MDDEFNSASTVAALLVADLRRERFKATRPACPTCGAPQCQRWGQFAGRQRYRCASCLKSFSDLSGTAFERCRRIDQWPKVLACMNQSLSVRQTAAVVGIAPSTVFRWRHRILSALATEQAIRRLDPKWTRVWLNRVVLGRKASWRAGGQTSGAVYPVALLWNRCGTRGRLERFAVPQPPEPERWDPMHCFGGVSDQSRALRTITGVEGWRSPFALACRRQGLRYVADPLRRSKELSGSRKEAIRLRRWLHRFRGVRLSYLPNYLAWYGALFWSGASLRSAEQLWRAGLKNQQLPRTLPEARGEAGSPHPPHPPNPP